MGKGVRGRNASKRAERRNYSGKGEEQNISQDETWQKETGYVLQGILGKKRKNLSQQTHELHPQKLMSELKTKEPAKRGQINRCAWGQNV